MGKRRRRWSRDRRGEVFQAAVKAAMSNSYIIGTLSVPFHSCNTHRMEDKASVGVVRY